MLCFFLVGFISASLAVPLHLERARARGECLDKKVKCVFVLPDYVNNDCQNPGNCILKDDLGCCKPPVCGSGPVVCEHTKGLRAIAHNDHIPCGTCKKNSLLCCQKMTCATVDVAHCPSQAAYGGGVRRAGMKKRDTDECIDCLTECCYLGRGWLKLTHVADDGLCKDWTITELKQAEYNNNIDEVEIGISPFYASQIARWRVTGQLPHEGDVSVAFKTFMNARAGVPVSGHGGAATAGPGVITYYYNPAHGGQRGVLKWGTSDTNDHRLVVTREMRAGVGSLIGFHNLNNIAVTTCTAYAVGLPFDHDTDSKFNVGDIEIGWRKAYRTRGEEDIDGGGRERVIAHIGVRESNLRASHWYQGREIPLAPPQGRTLSQLCTEFHLQNKVAADPEETTRLNFYTTWLRDEAYCGQVEH